MLAIFSLLGSSIALGGQWSTQETSVHWAGGQITFERARWGDVPLDGPPLVVWSDGQGVRARLRRLPTLEQEY